MGQSIGNTVNLKDTPGTLTGKRPFALVTGCSSGIGRETALLLAANGFHVFATARQVESLEELCRQASPGTLTPVPLDLADRASIERCVQLTEELSGGIDLLVNSAGCSVAGPIETLERDQLLQLFEVNFFGLIQLTQWIVAGMRVRGRGRIINLSSIVGRIKIPFEGAYVASKHALEAVSDALRYELRPFGIDVVVVEPATVATPFLKRSRAGLDSAAPGFEAYRDALHGFEARRSQEFLEACHPRQIAEIILRAAAARRPAFRYVHPAYRRLQIFIMNLLPDRLRHQLLRQAFRRPASSLRPGRPHTTSSTSDFAPGSLASSDKPNSVHPVQAEELTIPTSTDNAMLNEAPPAEAPRHRRWGGLTFALIALLAFGTYLNSLGNYFLLDDFWHLNWISKTEWKDVLQPWVYGADDYRSQWSSGKRLAELEETAYFRPMVTVLYRLMREAFGFDAAGYHFISILLHAVASVVFYWCFLPFFRARSALLIAALVFAVHPAHGEAVQWVAANTYLLTTTFFLLSVGTFVRWLISKDGTGTPAHENGTAGGQGEPSTDPPGARKQNLARLPHSRYKHWLYAVSLGCFVLALLSHELAVTLPAVLLFTDWVVSRRFKFGEIIWRHGAFLIVAVAYLFFHFEVLHGLQTVNQAATYVQRTGDPNFALNAIFQIAYGLFHLGLPFPFLPVTGSELSSIAGFWNVLLGCTVVIIGCGFVWFRLFSRDKRGWLGLGFFILTLAPTLLVLSAQRLLYLPSIGFCLLLALLFERLIKVPSLCNRASALVPDLVLRPARGSNGIRDEVGLKPRLVMKGLVALLIGGLALLTALYNVQWSIPGDIVRRQVEAISAASRQAAPGATIYLCNVWPPALGLETMLSLQSRDPHRSAAATDVQILTVHPKLLPIDTPTSGLEKVIVSYFTKILAEQTGDAPVTAVWDDVNTLRISIEKGRFTRSTIEQIVSGIYPMTAGQTFRMKGFTAEILKADARGVQAVRFHFAPGSARLFFDLRRGNVRRLDPA
jgi:short-subunit dehydrogenase